MKRTPLFSAIAAIAACTQAPVSVGDATDAISASSEAPVLEEAPMPEPKPPPPPGDPTPDIERKAARGPASVALDPSVVLSRGVEKTPADASKYVDHGVNGWTSPREDKLSTFAVDVDTGSYTMAKRFLERGNRPNSASVRVEEWVNAFDYDYEGPKDEHPFAVHLAAAPSPITDGATLLRVGVQGKRISREERQPAHITFLVDISGSMRAQDKLPLAQRAMNVFVDGLDARDSVAIATYAGANRVVLDATRATGEGKSKIRKAIAALMTRGGTNMGNGMELAYREAGKHLSSERMSRVVVLSDGDANIGRTTHAQILEAIRGYVSEGVTLSTVGFGTGNYNDHLMEQLANAGNGNYSYIDSEKTAMRVFGEQLTSTLQVIAKDVKIQVEFDDTLIDSYRLIGYENRDIADQDFRDDQVDAGEIGAGHTVTALYEVIPKEGSLSKFATVRVRYKDPRGEKAKELRYDDAEFASEFTELDVDTRFATGVALAAEILRGSPHASEHEIGDALRIVKGAGAGRDRAELVRLLSALNKRELVTRR